MARRRLTQELESAREVLVLLGASAMLLLGTALVVAMSVGTAAAS